MNSLIARLSICVGVTLLLVSCREIVEKEADEKLALAETALQQERWDAADESFHDAILLDPDRADAWIGRGMTLTKMGDIEEARIHYQEALSICQKRSQIDSLAPEPIRRQIMLLVLLDRGDEARALAEATAETHPDRDFGENMPKLVDTLSREFEEMILPEPTEKKENYPPLKFFEKEL